MDNEANTESEIMAGESSQVPERQPQVEKKLNSALSLENIYCQIYQNTHGENPLQVLEAQKTAELRQLNPPGSSNSTSDEMERMWATSREYSVKEVGFPNQEIGELHNMMPHGRDFFASTEYKTALLQSAIKLDEFVHNKTDNSDMLAERLAREKLTWQTAIVRNLHNAAQDEGSIDIDSASVLKSLIEDEKPVDGDREFYQLDEKTAREFSVQLSTVLHEIGLSDEEIKAGKELLCESLGIKLEPTHPVGEENPLSCQSALPPAELPKLTSLLKSEYAGSLLIPLFHYNFQETKDPAAFAKQSLDRQIWLAHPERYDLDKVKTAYYRSVIP